MKDITPLIVLLVFFIFLALIMVAVMPKQPAGAGQPSGSLCTSSEKRPCTLGSCEGTATCINGIWSGCRWEQICSPGFREPCVQLGCAYAVRECNECGTGWGECLPLNVS